MVRVDEAICTRARSDGSTRSRALHGFDGRLVVLAEPGIALGDCRIEWADGGLARDRAATEAAIGEAVEPLRRGAPRQRRSMRFWRFER